MFEETYRRVAADGDEVISLHVASTLSGMYNSAQLGAEAVPEAHVTVYDSETVTMGLGWMCVAAARAARQGQSVAQIVALLDEMKTRAHVFAALDTLDFLRRSGRVGWASAMMGQLLNVKPIVGVYRGVVSLLERVRTRARSVQRLEELVTRPGPTGIAGCAAHDGARGRAAIGARPGPPGSAAYPGRRSHARHRHARRAERAGAGGHRRSVERRA